MSTPPLPAWTDLERDARFAPPEACEQNATRFERTIRRRNLIEYAAGALVLMLFGGAALAAFWKGMTVFGLGFALVFAGTIFVLRTLARHGSTEPRRPEDSCREHLRKQYRRQYELLRSVPVWYIGPFLPGVLLIYVYVTVRVAEKVGLAVALQGIAVPALITFGIFTGIILLNLWAARRLAHEIAVLDDLAG